MGAINYRLNPFTGAMNAVLISNEEHIIPSVSPYWVRLNEVPLKESPSSMKVYLFTGSSFVQMSEVAAQPASGQFWPDYSAAPGGDTEWNTGLLLFSSAQAGMKIRVNYKGTGMPVAAESEEKIHGTERFDTPGNYVWNCPHGVTKVYVTAVGGGGISGNSHPDGGPGGRGGNGYSYLKAPVAVAPDTSYAVHVGAAAYRNMSGGGGIVDAEDTTFGSLLTAVHGENGGNATGGGPGTDGAGGWNILQYGVGQSQPYSAAATGGLLIIEW